MLTGIKSGQKTGTPPDKVNNPYRAQANQITGRAHLLKFMRQLNGFEQVRLQDIGETHKGLYIGGKQEETLDKSQGEKNPSQ